MIINWPQYINTTLGIQCYDSTSTIGKLYGLHTVKGVACLHILADGCTWTIPISDIRTVWTLVMDNGPQIPNLTND